MNIFLSLFLFIPFILTSIFYFGILQSSLINLYSQGFEFLVKKQSGYVKALL